MKEVFVKGEDQITKTSLSFTQLSHFGRYDVIFEAYFP
jgi:hypothetical protein